jgi:hypothetical protein
MMGAEYNLQNIFHKIFTKTHSKASSPRKKLNVSGFIYYLLIIKQDDRILPIAQ